MPLTMYLRSFSLLAVNVSIDIDIFDCENISSILTGSIYQKKELHRSPYKRHKVRHVEKNLDNLPELFHCLEKPLYASQIANSSSLSLL